MYVRDHDRPAMHAAFGIDPTDYDFTVFRITSEISKQAFPLTLDLDNPAFHAGLERLRQIAKATTGAKARGGVLSWLQRIGLGLSAGVVFARLYMLPVSHNEIPQQIRVAPAW